MVKEIDKKGRKVKYTEDFAREIISKYLDTYKSIKNLNYKYIYEYTVELKINNELKEIPEISYWRKVGRTGREIIDEHNRILLDSSTDVNLDIELLNLLKLLDGKFISKQNFNIVKDYSEKKVEYIKKITGDYIRLEEEMEILKSKNKAFHQRNIETEKLLINIYHYIMNNKQFENTHTFSRAYMDIFDNPTSFTEEKFLNSKKNTKNKTIRNLFEGKLNK